MANNRLDTIKEKVLKAKYAFKSYPPHFDKLPGRGACDRSLLIPGILPIAGESQGGTTITLAIRTPKRLQ